MQSPLIYYILIKESFFTDWINIQQPYIRHFLCINKTQSLLLIPTNIWFHLTKVMITMVRSVETIFYHIIIDERSSQKCKWKHPETPSPVDTRRRFNVYKTSIRRLIEVETASCAYWEIWFDLIWYVFLKSVTTYQYYEFLHHHPPALRFLRK